LIPAYLSRLIFQSPGRKKMKRHKLSPVVDNQGAIMIKKAIFNHSNLAAIINSTTDMMWSIDRNYQLIASNNAFYENINYMRRAVVSKQSSVFTADKSDEQLGHWKKSYDKAFSGESFSETQYMGFPVEEWYEISFYPIHEEAKIIGTACYSHNITKHKIAEEKTRQSKANLRAIFENSSESLFLTDTNGIIMAFNNNAQKTNLLTCKKEMQTQRNILDYIAVPRKQLFKNMMLEVAAGKAVQYDQGFTDLEGRFHCFDFSINPVKEDGVVTSICFTGRDITERSLANEKIEHNEKRYRALVEHGGDAIIILSAEGKPLYVSPSIEKVLGYTEKEVMQMDLFKQTHPDDLAGVNKQLQWSVANRAVPVKGRPGRVRHKDGSWHWYEATLTNMLHEPAIGGIVNNFRDVTERYLQTRALKQNQEQLQKMMDNSIDVICSTDEEGRFLMVSKACKSTWGYQPEELIGKRFIDLVLEEDKAATIEIARSIIAGNNVADFENRYIRKDGGTVPVMWSATWNAEERTMFSIAHDITDKKRAEELFTEERNRFADLFYQAPSGICFLRGAGHIFEMANPLYLQLSGRKDIIGKTVLEVFPELAEQGFYKILDNVYKTGVPFNGNEILMQIDRDGNGTLTDYYLDFVYQPYKNTNGEIDGVFFFANLVTEQVLAHKEMEKRAAELIVANEELVFQNEEKEKRAAELIVANKELVFQNEEKGKRAAELIVANKELVFQNEEKGKRAAELIVANEELVFQNEEKGKRAAELIVANEELVFQNEEKGKRAAELIVANKELVFQNEEKGKRAAELIVANRLYTFISAINQTIVHAKDERTLFKDACRIAIDIGKFELALISIPDEINRKLNVVEYCNAIPGDVKFFNDLIYDIGGPTAMVYNSGKLHLINDYENEPAISTTKKFAAQRGLKSCILLPIKKSGKTIGVYNLYATSANLFDEAEIRLLDEAAGDISFALDVFEKEKHRKQMEDKVRRSELQLKQAQAIAHFGSWELDYSTGIAEWSEEACRIYGFHCEENMQSYQSWLSFLHPDDRERVMNTINNAKQTLSSVAFNHRIIRKDRAVRQIYTQAQFEFNKEGIPVVLNGVAHDITEMYETEKALEQSEANLRLIMDLIPQSVFAKDYNGKFVFVNNSFANLYGVTQKELIGKTLLDTIPVKKEAAGFLEQDRDVITSGETKTIPEYIFTDHLENTRLFHITKVPFTVAGTNKKAVLGIIMDITEQKKAEAERTKMMADIMQRNNDLEQFSYIISHNLRAPVANIIGIADIIQTIELSKEEGKNAAGYLAVAVKNLDVVIRDLNYILQVKHTERKKKELVKLSALVSDIKLSIDSFIRIDHVEIVNDFSAVDELLTIKSYLYSIFFNLISNSIKYRQPGITPVIKISTATPNDKIEIIYKDNGMGIDLGKTGDQVFGLYKRFHHHVEGKGMGLYMVKTQVESLGGKIGIASEVNKGTEFRIEFENNEQNQKT